MLSFEYQNKFKIITFYKDEMFHIILHQKEQLYDLQNYLESNVFFIHWIARGKYRLFVFCITLKWAKPSSMPMSAPAPSGGRDGYIPRHFAGHVTPISTLIGPLAQLQRSEVAADLQQKLGESTDWS